MDLAAVTLDRMADPAETAAPAVATADLTEPRRGAKRRYLHDRPLTARERYELRKARQRGELPIIPPPRVYSQAEFDAAVNDAYQRGYEAGLKG